MNDLSLCLFCWLHTKELCDLSDPKGLTGNPKVIQVENGSRLLDSMRTMTQLDSLRCNLNPIVCYSVGNGEFLWEFFLFFFRNRPPMLRRTAKLESSPLCEFLSPSATCRRHHRKIPGRFVPARTTGRDVTILVAFLVPSKRRESLVAPMRKQPDHWRTQLRSRSERRQPSPESSRRVFGPDNETCQRIL